MIFLPGNVGSRPGFHAIFPVQPFPAGVRVNYQKTYVQPNGVPLNLYLTSDGKLLKEDITASPGTFTQIGQVSPGSTAMSVTFDGREYFAFSDGVHGTDVPLQYDGTNLDRVTQDGPGTNCTAADSATGGNVTIGLHNFVVMFQTRNGYVTAPSVNSNWNAAGGKRVSITNLPIGPPDTVARIVAFSGAGGFNFFYIPTTPYVGGVAVGTSTVVLDNTSTTATFDFADNTLFNSTAIDIPGNNLFQNLPLPQCLGVFAYSQRLIYFGMDNRVPNFVNMGFDGGYDTFVTPLGWNADTPGAQLQNGPNGGFSVFLSSNGSSPHAVLSQTAYQDEFSIPILQGATKYTAKLRANAISGTTGNLVVDVFSSSIGLILSGQIPLAAVPVGSWETFTFSMGNAGPVAVIPSDARLRIYLSGVPNTKGVTVDDLEILYTETPYINNRAIASYVNAPEQFDALTGQFGPATDPSPILCCSILRDTMRMKTTQGMHTTNDNGTTEPNGWTVNTFSRTVGALSIKGGDPGMFGSGDTAEDWDLTASRGGLYIDFGGDLYKVSQEEQSLWDSINWPYASTIWIKNDTINRRVYIGLPVEGSFYPNVVAVMDYRELDAAMQIASAAPVHISFTGRMISSDLTRKWNTWSVPANCGEVMLRPQNGREMCFGTWGSVSNVYYLDPLQLHDDMSEKLISPYYTTYAFLNHDAEVALGTGVHRKLYRYLTMFASGVGLLTVTPYVDSLTNGWSPLPPYILTLSPTFDIEWGVNVTGERCFFKIASSPIQELITLVNAANIVTVNNSFRFSVGQTVQILNALFISLGTAVVQAIDPTTNQVTATANYPAGTVAGAYVVNTNWPDNSFKLNKMVVSIQAEPMAPVRGAY